MTPTAHSAPRLALVGSWPPPAGGVSIHTQRLSALLDARGAEFVVYNATSDAGDGKKVIGVFRNRRRWLIKYLFTGREEAVYLFSGRLSAWVVGGLMAALRGKRVMLRLRNSSLIDWCAASRWKRMLCGWALRRMNAIVCVNRHLVDAVRGMGVPPERIHWSPGFLPPDPAERERSTVDPAIWEFTSAHAPLIAANGRVEWHQQVDLYGLDLLVELAGRLRADFPQLGVVVCFWDHAAGDEAYLQRLKARAAELGVADAVLFHTRFGPFVPVLAAADVFVRPTVTDGDANSVREALYLGVPAVASDVVERPAGTFTFANRDLDAFTAQVRAALSATRAEHTAPALPESDRRRIDAYLDLIAALASGGELPTAGLQPAGQN